MCSPIESDFERGLGDELNALFTSGKLTWELPKVPAIEETPEQKAANLVAKRTFFDRDVFGIFFARERAPSRGADEIALFKHFNTAKEMKISELEKKGDEMSRFVIDNTTIIDAHRHTQRQLSHFTSEMAMYPRNSYEYYQAEIQASYWSVGEQLAKGAVEHSFGVNNNL